MYLEQPNTQTTTKLSGNTTSGQICRNGARWCHFLYGKGTSTNDLAWHFISACDPNSWRCPSGLMIVCCSSSYCVSIGSFNSPVDSCSVLLYLQLYVNLRDHSYTLDPMRAESHLAPPSFLSSVHAFHYATTNGHAPTSCCMYTWQCLCALLKRARSLLCMTVLFRAVCVFNIDYILTFETYTRYALPEIALLMHRRIKTDVSLLRVCFL